MASPTQTPNEDPEANPDVDLRALPDPDSEEKSGNEKRAIGSQYSDSLRVSATLAPRSRDIWKALSEEMITAGVFDIGDPPSKSEMLDRLLHSFVATDGEHLRSIDWSRVVREMEEPPAFGPKTKRAKKKR